MCITFVHGTESEMIGNNWTLLNSSLVIQLPPLFSWGILTQAYSFTWCTVVPVNFKREIIVDVIPSGDICKMNMLDIGMKVKEENPGSVYLPSQYRIMMGDSMGSLCVILVG